MYCPKCGSELNNGLKFCPNCGEQLQTKTKKTDNTNKRNASGLISLALLAVMFLMFYVDGLKFDALFFDYDFSLKDVFSLNNVLSDYLDYSIMKIMTCVLIGYYAAMFSSFALTVDNCLTGRYARESKFINVLTAAYEALMFAGVVVFANMNIGYKAFSLGAMGVMTMLVCAGVIIYELAYKKEK